MQNTITAFVQNNTTAVKSKNVSLLSSVLSDNCVKMYRPLSFVNKISAVFQGPDHERGIRGANENGAANYVRRSAERDPDCG